MSNIHMEYLIREGFSAKYSSPDGIYTLSSQVTINLLLAYFSEREVTIFRTVTIFGLRYG
jgi:hypothetical protein